MHKPSSKPKKIDGIIIVLILAVVIMAVSVYGNMNQTRNKLTNGKEAYMHPEKDTLIIEAS